jgi:hypothetical protein
MRGSEGFPRFGPSFLPFYTGWADGRDHLEGPTCHDQST